MGGSGCLVCFVVEPLHPPHISQMFIGWCWPGHSLTALSVDTFVLVGHIHHSWLSWQNSVHPDVESGSPRSCVLSDVSLHTQSSWANVWNTYWMASTGPVGKSHTVTFYCRDRNGSVNWERQTGKTPSRQSIYSLESRVIISCLSGVCKKTPCLEGPLTSQVLKPMNMEYSWVCSKADIVFKFMFVLYKWKSCWD